MAKQQEVKLEDLIRDIRNKNYHVVYYLMGDESYYIDKVADYMADTILTPEEREFNQTIFYGADVTIETVINAAKRFPMMSEHQLIIVKEAQNLKNLEKLSYYLQKPQKSTILVFCHKNGTAVLIGKDAGLIGIDLLSQVHDLLLVKADHRPVDRKSADLVRSP